MSFRALPLLIPGLTRNLPHVIPGLTRNLPATQVENPLETDPGIPLIIDPPILFFSSDTQMQVVGIKNRSSLHSA